MRVQTLKQLGFLLGLPTISDASITGFAVDSRLVEKGNVFFALQGEKTDGHQFLEEAFSRGCSCFVLNHSYIGNTFDLPVIYVEDPLQTLQNLSQIVIESGSSKIVAITGSVGKTTTKDFLTTLLQEKFKVAKTPGNANSQIGLPLAILNHTDGLEEILVLEMGMNFPSQIAKLVKIAKPHVSILTKVALTHAGNFESLQEIAFEKAEIFNSPKIEVGFINKNTLYFDEICKIGSCPKISFSVVSEAVDPDFKNFTISTSAGLELNLNRSLHPYFGSHIYENLAAAIACANYFGLEMQEIQRGLPKLVLPKQRFEIVELEGIIFVNDSYNASEISVTAAFESLPLPKKQGKTIAVIGEMLELGKFSRMCHLNVAKKALQHIDQMLLLGKACAPIYECWTENGKPVELFLERENVQKALKRVVREGDVVLLKGSCSNQLWKILEEFRDIR